MNTNLTLHAGRIVASIASRRHRLPHAFPVAGVVALLAAFAWGVPWGVEAQDAGGGRVCSERTLHGDYGLIVTGVRGLGPGASETFATVSMVTYDGLGGFSAIGVSHGQVTVRAPPVLHGATSSALGDLP